MVVKSSSLFSAIIAFALLCAIPHVLVQAPTCTKTTTGTCCEFASSTYCCPAPLLPKPNAKCCVGDSDSCCELSRIHLHPVPKCCEANGHCCPVTSVPENGTSKCCTLNNNGTKQCCELPELPSGECCMLPGVPADVLDMDAPQYQLVPPYYMPTMSANDTIHSDFKNCEHEIIIRKSFGNPVLPPEAHGVPIYWADFLSIRKAVRPKVLGESLTKIFWPEVIIPFLFPLMIVVMAILSIIPFMLAGGIGWAVLFNLRFLAHKKIRMLIRAYLIRLEKFRRWKYERSFPLQHLRKFRERDRYQMPKAFQDSDLSSDDEPEELAREQIPRQKTTMWTESEIEIIGFDPDNIPMDWVYGDLLGNPEALRPEVKEYINLRKGPTRNDDFDRGSLNSDEWTDFLRNRNTEKMQREKDMFMNTVHDKFKGTPDRKGSGGSHDSSIKSDATDRDRDRKGS